MALNKSQKKNYFLPHVLDLKNFGEVLKKNFSQKEFDLWIEINQLNSLLKQKESSLFSVRQMGMFRFYKNRLGKPW